MNVREEHMHNTHAIQILVNDVVETPPLYLCLLLKLGPKYVPHPNPKYFVPKLNVLQHECVDLCPVLGWSAFFAKQKQDDPASCVDLRGGLPYYKLYRFSGAEMLENVIAKIASVYGEICTATKHASDHCLLSISHLNNVPLFRRGVTFKPSLVDEYLSNHVVVPADKDGSLVIMRLCTYQTEVQNHMSSPVYRKLDGTVEQWEQKAQRWMMSLHVFTCNFLPESLTKVLGNFLAQAKKPVMAKFHLSCKTHKSMHLSPQGGWAWRPLVGLYRWCTTSVSYLLAVGGSILLKLDRFREPVQCVLKDTSDALARMRTTEATKFVKVSTIDFASLYTTIRWTDVSHAFRFRQTWFVLNVDWRNISVEERAFMGMLFNSVPKEEFDFLCAHFPFFAMQYSPDLTVGECLQHILFFHTVFETPGLSVFLQLIGFPMGTNCAPTWANLVLRVYEWLRPLTDMLLFRFIDDGLVLHQPEVDEKQFLERMISCLTSVREPTLRQFILLQQPNLQGPLPNLGGPIAFSHHLILLLLLLLQIHVSLHHVMTHTCPWRPPCHGPGFGGRHRVFPRHLLLSGFFPLGHVCRKALRKGKQT